MAVIYATLIVKGKKTFDQVPDKIKEQVKEVLIDLEVPELAE
ncbi:MULTISPECIES: CD1375 family protein [Erysipelotrichales]|nr:MULTISPECIES: CD1375 family protein [Erysipelotrichales]